MYAFIHAGKSYTPSPVDPPTTIETTAEWNRAVVAAELQRIPDRVPVVVYPKAAVTGSPVTLWPGDIVGHVCRITSARTGFHRTTVFRFRWRDLSGKLWYGQGAGGGMCLLSRPMRSR
jgi:hypothetical protein